MLKKLSKRLPLYGRVPRRVMAVALSLVMCLGMLPASALAAGSAEAMWGASADNLSSSGTFVAAMDAANNAASGTTYIQLQKDVTLGSAWSVDSGRTTVLDLNGKIIDRGLTGGAAQANGYVVDSKGNLTIKDSSTPSTGKITGGNNGSDGGGVHVDGGSFTLAGGSITSNTSNS
ncbi:MAG: hypothetical protein RR731_07865, partial [Oscillospiraceae bacterium]